MNTVVLPNGRKCSIPSYIASWQRLKTLAYETEIDGWEWYPCPVRDILRQLHDVLHARINRHDPRYGKGRKWEDRYQIDQRRDACWIADYTKRGIIGPINQLSTPELQRWFRMALYERWVGDKELPMKTSEMLIRAKALIDTPEKWSSYGPGDGENTKCCVTALIRAARSHHRYYHLDTLFSRANELTMTIGDWNDIPGRTHAEIMTAFDTAIAAALAEEIK
jgi:hypothetical protein